MSSIERLALMTSLLLRLFRRQFHVLGNYGNRGALVRHIDMSRPQNSIHDALTKSLVAEVVMKMAADEAERSSPGGARPFVDPGDRIFHALNHGAHYRLGFG